MGDHREVITMEHDESLDCMGMMCPMPIVELSRRMSTLQSGKVLEMTADDEGVIEDVPSWCRRTGNVFLGQETEGDVIRSYIRKA